MPPSSSDRGAKAPSLQEGPPPPRAIPAGGPGPIPTKDREGRTIPTNKVLFAKWGKTFKEPSEPPPPFTELDWEHFGPAESDTRKEEERAPISVEEALTPDVVQYLEGHGINEALKRAIQAVVQVTPRPADPIMAMGRFISAEAEKASGTGPEGEGNSAGVDETAEALGAAKLADSDMGSEAQGEAAPASAVEMS